MPREERVGQADADEPVLWAYLKWARLDRAIAGSVDHVEAVDVYKSLLREPDRVRRYLAWLEERAGPGAIEHVLARAKKAARSRPLIPGPLRRIRVTAPED